MTPGSAAAPGDLARFRRFAVYFLPDGALGRFGSRWLGWDAATGARPAPPDLPGLPAPAAALTATPRRYGFHATLKPPFHLAAGATPAALDAAVAALAGRLAPVQRDGLAVAHSGRFVALLPEGGDGPLAGLAAAAVEALDPFRAPSEPAELALRRRPGLTPAEDALLLRWGYPYVMDAFHFHLTLTGGLAPEAANAAREALVPAFAPHLPRPFSLDALSLLGEERDGFFRLIRRYPLGG